MLLILGLLLNSKPLLPRGHESVLYAVLFPALMGYRAGHEEAHRAARGGRGGGMQTWNGDN